jgi:hypothetical protein
MASGGVAAPLLSVHNRPDRLAQRPRATGVVQRAGAVTHATARALIAGSCSRRSARPSIASPQLLTASRRIGTAELNPGGFGRRASATVCRNERATLRRVDRSVSCIARSARASGAPAG